MTNDDIADYIESEEVLRRRLEDCEDQLEQIIVATDAHKENTVSSRR